MSCHGAHLLDEQNVLNISYDKAIGGRWASPQGAVFTRNIDGLESPFKGIGVSKSAL